MSVFVTKPNPHRTYTRTKTNLILDQQLSRMALTVLVSIYVMTLKQIEAESAVHPAVAVALLTVHLGTFLSQTLQEPSQQETTSSNKTIHPSLHNFQIQEPQPTVTTTI